MRIPIRSLCCAALVVGPLLGCMDALEEQTKKSPNSIIGKKTQDVGEFNPDAKQEVSDSKVQVDNPVTYGLQAYRPMVEQIMKSYIEHALNLFNAIHGRYPKDHQEFMEKIIKANRIQLPVLPGEWQYKYDVENHKLEVVRAITDEEAEPG